MSTTNGRSPNPVYRLGVVSFLNSRPLIAGLDEDPRVALCYDVPARLPALLDEGKVDAALIPIVDVLRSSGRYRVVSDACIGCDGETMTVRVFSQVPPDRVETLWVDGDSHTSVALAKLLWRELYDRELELRRVDARREKLSELSAVLLIGDKVVDPARESFAYEVDLGGAWRQHTGLPFVFAVWAFRTDLRRNEPRALARADERTRDGQLGDLLSAARDRGVARAMEIAETHGPQLGWPVELARRYLTRCLRFKLDARSIEGANLFGRLCAQADIVLSGAQIVWPEDLVRHVAADAPAGRG
jgi:chorismate dehydratase